MSADRIAEAEADRRGAYAMAIAGVCVALSTDLLELTFSGHALDVAGIDGEATSTIGTLAIRIRTPGIHQRDFTLRSKTRGGGATEVDKLEAGGGARWYIYAWAKDATRFDEYVVVDCDVLRAARPWVDLPTTRNRDGSGFVAIPIDTLRLLGAIRLDGRHHVHGWARVKGQWVCIQDFYAVGFAPKTGCGETWP